MKTIRVFVAMLAALLLTAGLLTACGSDEKADYAEQVEAVLNPLGDDLQALGTELSSAPDEAALADGLKQAETDLSDAVSELEAISVPDGVEQVNEDLITAISEFTAELTKVRRAAESGNLAELQRTALALPQVASSFEQRLNDIQQAAIDAGVPIEEPSN